MDDKCGLSGARSESNDKIYLFDAKLWAMTEAILSVPVEQRIHQIEAETEFFANIRPLDD